MAQIMEKSVGGEKQTNPIITTFPSLWSIFWTFLKIGAFTFGGGFAMISLIEQELVQRQRWIQPSEFLDCVSSVQLIPGAVAINMSLFTGYRMRGTVGGLVAAAGVALPSFVVISAIAAAFGDFHNSKVAVNFFLGVRPVVVGLILATALRIGGQTLDVGWKWIAVVVGLLIMFLFKIHPIAIVLMAAATGLLLAD
jgi:chromate transporter